MIVGIGHILHLRKLIDARIIDEHINGADLGKDFAHSLLVGDICAEKAYVGKFLSCRLCGGFIRRIECDDFKSHAEKKAAAGKPDAARSARNEGSHAFSFCMQAMISSATSSTDLPSVSTM